MERVQERLLIGKVEKDSKFREAIEESYFNVFTGYPWYDKISLKDSKRICKRYFDDDRYTVLGGLEEGKLIGFVIIKNVDDVEIPDSISKFNKQNLGALYIEETGINPERQRQRLGKELLEYVMEKYLNCFIYFTTNNSPDSPMVKLTRSLGFELVTDENNNVKVFSQDEEKGSPTERCALFYSNVRNKEVQNKQPDEEGR